MTALASALAARNELHKSSYWPAALRQKGSNHLWLTDVNLAAAISALTPITAPVDKPYTWIDFEGVFPDPGWYTSEFFPTGVSFAKVADPLGIEGQVLRASCVYAPSLPTDYSNGGLQQVAYSAYDNAVAHASPGQDTWYRFKFMAPAGNVFASGFTNFITEWHTAAAGPTSSGLFAFGGYPLVAAGTKTPKLTFVLRHGTIASPIEHYFPGNVSDVNQAAGPAWVPDRWYDCVFHIKWARDGSGVFEWWLDGAKLASYTGPTFYDDTSETAYSIAVYNYRYNVTGDSNLHYALISNGPSAASIGFTL